MTIGRPQRNANAIPVFVRALRRPVLISGGFLWDGMLLLATEFS